MSSSIEAGGATANETGGEGGTRGGGTTATARRSNEAVGGAVWPGATVDVGGAVEEA